MHRLKPFIFCLRLGCLFFAIIAILPNVGLAATYYLDAVNGNYNNPGTSVQPWKTIGKAQVTVTSGDTVKLRDGNYGAYEETGVTRTNWVTYKNDTNATPVFTKIKINNSSPIKNPDNRTSRRISTHLSAGSLQARFRITRPLHG